MKGRDIFLYTKKRIIIISMAIVFLCLFIFAGVIQRFYVSRLYNEIDDRLIKEKLIHEKAPFLLKDIRPKPSLNNDIKVPPYLIIFIYEGDNLIFSSPNSYFYEEETPILPEGKEDEIVNITHDGYNFRGISFNKGDYRIQLLINIDPELKSIKQLNYAIIIGLFILLLIAGILAVYLASRVIRPVKEAYDKQVLFVQDASHEMRTPLAIIKGKLELLVANRKETIENLFLHISQMMSEIRGLEKLNSDLLLLSKEDVDSSVYCTTFDLTEFINDISQFYFDLAEVHNKKFNVIKPEVKTLVVWDYNKMKRAVTILLENAFKYTEEGDNIDLKVVTTDKHIKIIVADTGIGIKADELDRIFDRFFRSAEVRGKNIGGSGIGLSLLKSFSKTLGFKIGIRSEYGVGSEFTLSVPKKMN